MADWGEQLPHVVEEGADHQLRVLARPEQQHCLHYLLPYTVSKQYLHYLV